MSPAPTANGGSLMATRRLSPSSTGRTRTSHPRGTRHRPAVPTWNYAAVHVYGKPRAREEGDFTAAALRDLVARHEGSRAKPWRTEDLAGDFYEKLAKAIVAFEMPIDRIEGKFKLGQNRSQDDRLGMLKGLDAEKSPDAGALAAFIRETLKSDGGV